jgi:hypothetical protein
VGSQTYVKKKNVKEEKSEALAERQSSFKERART